MISGVEQMRRLLVFYHALREAHDDLVDTTQREVDRDNLDWFHRERLDSMLESHSRVRRAVEEMRFEAAYDGEPVSVKCTPEERLEALRLAVQILKREASPESVLDRILNDDFPRGPSNES